MKLLFFIALLFVVAAAHFAVAQQHSLPGHMKIEELPPYMFSHAIDLAAPIVPELYRIVSNSNRPKMPVYNPDDVEAKMNVWNASSGVHYFMPNAYPVN